MNMNRQTLYGNLVRGIYTLDGIDGEFLANLCRRFPFKPKAVEWADSGVLTEIPANVMRQAEAACSDAEAEVASVRESALDNWSDDEWVSLHAERMAEVKAELVKAEVKLAACSAA